MLDQLEKSVVFASASDEGSITNSADQVVENTYDTGGRVQTVKTYNNASGTALTTTHAYDSIGRLVLTTDAAGNKVEYVYDEWLDFGLLIQRIEKDSSNVVRRSTSFSYDDLDRVAIQTVQGTGELAFEETWFTYDALDRRVSMIDPKGTKTAYEYDKLGNQTAMVEDANGLARRTESVYDRLSRLKELKAFDGAQTQTTTYTYDLAGRRTEIKYPDSTGASDVVAFEYDLAGRMTEKTDQRGIVSAYAYDGRGLLLTKIGAGPGIPSGSERFEFAYDGAGRMTMARRGTDSSYEAVSRDDFAYSDLWALTSETQALFGSASKTVSYTADQLGNRKQIVYPSGTSLTLDYTIDGLNRVATIVRSSATLATYTYDWMHFTQRRVKTTATAATYVTHKLEYDSYNRIKRITNLGEPNGRFVLLAAFDYTYDIVGNRLTTIGEGNQAAEPDVAYDYDGLYRLTEAQYPDLGGSETFRYDKLGNRDGDGTGDVYGYTDTRYGTPSGAAEIAYGANNAVNEYDSIAGVTINYDAAGNLTKDEKGLSYEYDLDNKLRRIYDDDNSDGGWDSGEDRYLEFIYDALGRRIETKDYADSQSNPKITRFYWDGQNVISEYVYNGSTYDLTRWYAHGPTYIDERVIVKDVPNSKEYYYFQKELYSVAGLADKDGKLKEAYAYDAYGKVRIYQPNPIAGDSDSDKDVDLEDFAAFANCFDEDVTVNTGCAWANFIDESSDIVDLEDYGAVYPCMTGPFAPLGATGDWNGDSQVNTTDLTAFMTCWLSTPTDSTCLTKFDFDASGLIDLGDYGVMLSLVYPTIVTCLTQVRISSLNPYFFTGHRGNAGSTASVSYECRARTLNSAHAHWLQRDLPRFTDGMNLYGYIKSRPTYYVDPDGLQATQPSSAPSDTQPATQPAASQPACPCVAKPETCFLAVVFNIPTGSRLPNGWATSTRSLAEKWARHRCEQPNEYSFKATVNALIELRSTEFGADFSGCSLHQSVVKKEGVTLCGQDVKWDLKWDDWHTGVRPAVGGADWFYDGPGVGGNEWWPKCDTLASFSWRAKIFVREAPSVSKTWGFDASFSYRPPAVPYSEGTVTVNWFGGN